MSSHYTHLLGLWSGRRAAREGRLHVTSDDLDHAISDALINATGGVQQQWEDAVATSQTLNLFKSVLLACALSRKDSLGRFSVIDLREPLRQILNRDYRTVAYQGHLAKFCEPSRGPVLRRSGRRKSYRWQFINPQLVPYIRLRGVQEGLISG